MKDLIPTINFEKAGGLVPAIIQDESNNQVLMLGFMNREALETTMKTKKVTFYSRTKQRLWTKGETSGNFLVLENIKADCDSDTLLIKVTPEGPVCHTGSYTCFTNEIETKNGFLYYLQNFILNRKEEMPEGSYTTKLFQKGINKIAQKVGEEAVELVIESKDNNADLFLNEAADLFYHTMVLLASKGYGIKDVEKILENRHR